MAMPKKKREGGRTKTNRAGRELLASVREAHQAVTSGDFTSLTIRDVEIPEPGVWGATEVKALRERLGVSHRVFADLVGISRHLAAHWEHGIRRPARLACRLLDKISEDPDAYLSSLVIRKAG